MKLTSILVLAMMATGAALGQNPDLIQNTKNTMNAVQQKKTADTNTALAASQGQASAAKTAAASKPSPAATSAKPVVKPVSASTPVKSGAPATVAASTAKKTPVVKVAPQVIAAPKTAKKATPQAKVAKAKKPAPEQKVEVQAQNPPDASKDKDTSKTINLSGRRDPFVSPVVNRSMVGSGCSTGKKCLAIDQINLKGVVKSDNGMIAVVVNAMNKAYFLRENDPVFNGYVVKITGDSIVFKETIQDKLGKPFTRDVTKKITTSAV